MEIKRQVDVGLQLDDSARSTCVTVCCEMAHKSTQVIIALFEESGRLCGHLWLFCIRYVKEVAR